MTSVNNRAGIAVNKINRQSPGSVADSTAMNPASIAPVRSLIYQKKNTKRTTVIIAVALVAMITVVVIIGTGGSRISGTWVDTKYDSVVYKFSWNSFIAYSNTSKGYLEMEKGTYSVSDGQIIFHFSGHNSTRVYSFQRTGRNTMIIDGMEFACKR